MIRPQKHKRQTKANFQRKVLNLQGPGPSSAHDRLERTAGNLTSPPAGTATQEEAKAPATHIFRNLVSSPTLTISVDSVALYSINSTRGSILGLLRKGTVVVPSLRVMDGDVNWVLVRVPELNVSGFIQTEKLVSNSGGY